ncbi:LysR family transcriptional regulator [Hydrogenophaga sp. OTU3427]|uniref:LysR family transcriptional regulator n=1 Tax=Hydrogenophaga sp. OTU3427 TaxID=3043856 RepID=UPI00313C4FAF
MNLHNLNLGAMLNCLEIEQHRSINAAARSCDISQPALSRSIQTLERELGVPLFERASNGVVPTPYGETLLHHARNVQSELQRCVADIHERQQTGRMSMRIGASSSVVSWLVMPTIMATYQEQEHTNIGLVEAPPDDLMSRLLRGSIDLSIQPPEENVDEDVLGVPLAESEVGLVVGAHHPLASQSTVRPRDLERCLWLLPTWASAWTRRFQQDLLAMGLEQPQRVLMSNSYQALRQMLLDDDALAILPLEYVGADLRQGGLKRLPLDHPFAKVTYWAYVKRGRAMSAASIAFRDRLSAYATQQGKAASRVSEA